MPDASNKFTVRCDICGDAMKESAMAGAGYSAFLCYPCNNVIYESDLWKFEDAVCPSQSTSTPSSYSP